MVETVGGKCLSEPCGKLFGDIRGFVGQESELDIGNLPSDARIDVIVLR